MKRPLHCFSTFMCVTSLVSMMMIGVSCSFGVLPAFNKDAKKAEVSITLGSPVSAQSSDNGRAIIRGNGYLYIQTELTASKAIVYGPYAFLAGSTLTIPDIPAGTYSNVLVIVTPEVLASTFKALIPSDATAAGVRAALLASMAGQQNIIAGTSFGFLSNVTLNAGTTNTISTTLVPATTLSPDASGNVNLSGEAGEVTRCFISLANLKALFGGTVSSALTTLNATIKNTASATATISALGLYDSAGKLLSISTTESRLAVGGIDPFNTTWAGDDQLYLYVEFNGDSLQLTCAASIKTVTHTITYNSNNGTGTTVIRTLADGSTGPLETNTFTYSGYTFLGWTTTAGSTTVQYADTSPYTMPSSDVTFYAVWKDNASVVYRTITYDSNGGTGTMATRSVAEGSIIVLDANVYTRPSYAFLGWNLSSGMSTALYGDLASYTIGTGNVTLYAIWESTSAPVMTMPSINAGSQYASSTTVSFQSMYTISGSGIQKISLTGDIASVSSAIVLVNGVSVPFTPSGFTLSLNSVETSPTVTLAVQNIQMTSSEGSKQIYLFLTDALGHTSNTVSDTIFLDMTVPALDTVLLKNLSGTSSNYTNTTLVDFSFHVQPDASGIKTLTLNGTNLAGLTSPSVQVNGTTVGISVSSYFITLDTAVTSGGTIKISGISVDSGDGTKNILVTVTDASGLYSSGAANIILDTIAPTIPTVAAVSGAYPIGSVTNGGTVYIGPSAVFNLSSSGNSDFIVNGTPLGGVLHSITLINDLVPPTITAIDEAGNVSSAFNFSLSQDITPPSVTSVVVSDAANGYLTIYYTKSGTTSGIDLTYLVEQSGDSSSPGGGHVGATYDRYSLQGPITHGSASFEFSNLLASTNGYTDYVKITLTDAVGNQSAPYYVERNLSGTYSINAPSP